MNQMKNTYEMFFDEALVEGVFGISLVEEPAIVVEAVTFSKESKGLKTKELPQIQRVAFSDDSKQVMVSPALIPNQLIPREKVGAGQEPANVYFTAETIYQLQQHYFKENYIGQHMVEHEEKVDGVFVFESWIIEDPENDKANALGFTNLPKGTWMLSIKINNPEVWKDVKAGHIKGFSIDGDLLVRLKENVQMKKQNRMVAQFTARVKARLEAEDRKEFTLEDGTTVMATSLEVGQKLYDTEGNLKTDFTFDYDGKKYFTDSEGFINEVKNEEVELSDESMDPIIDSIEKIYEDKIAELEAENAELRKKILELEGEVEVAVTEVAEFKRNKPASRGVKTEVKMSVQNTGKIESVQSAIMNAVRGIK